MIEFKNVTKKYCGNTGIEDISLHIEKGEFVFLVGPSGAGKTTMIKLILKEVEADEGEITVNGTDVVKLPKKKIPEYRRGIGIVFQDFRLIEHKTIYENVAFALEIAYSNKERIAEKVPSVLDFMGMAEHADKYPGELSAGEQQRVAIARAVINNPEVLICDEPTGNLDPDTAEDIMKLLEIINSTGTTILMVTHARDIVDRMDKRVVALTEGRIVGEKVGEYRVAKKRQSKITFEQSDDKGEGGSEKK